MLNTVSEDYYLQEIERRWKGALQSILEAGQLLLEAKQNLLRVQFKHLLEELPFKKRTADRLMAIASDPRLTDNGYHKFLPSCWGTLYEISRLSDSQFKIAISQGILKPQATRSEINKFRHGVKPTKVIGASSALTKTVNLFTIRVHYDCRDFELLNGLREKLQSAVDDHTDLILIDSEWDQRTYKRETTRLMNKQAKEGVLAAKKVIRSLLKKIRARYTSKQWNGSSCPFKEKEQCKYLGNDEEKINWCLELLECPYKLHHFIDDPALADQYR